MRMRETETHDIFDRYANMLSARRPRNNKRNFSSRAHIAAIGNHSAPHNTPSDHAAENAELRQLLRDARESIYRLTGRDSPPPADTTPKPSGIAPPRYAAAYRAASPSLAAIQNQTSTAPGQHGVPFLHRRLDDQRNKRNNGDEAHPPGAAPPWPCPAPTATRWEISAFIRTNRICFRHAFGIPCGSSTKCPYNHNLIPEGYYKHLPRVNNSVRAHEPTPRPVGHTGTLAPSAESVNALAYLPGLQCGDDDESVGTPDTDTSHQEQPFIEAYPYTSGLDVWSPTVPGMNRGHALGAVDPGNMPSRAPQGRTPAEHRHRNDQLWVHRTVWHSKRVRPRIPVEILLDTGAGGGSYMSVALYCTLRQWGGVSQKLSTRGKGALHAANPTHCNIPPMRVSGSARIPIVSLPEDCVHKIAVSVVEGLPYGFTLGARFFYANRSILNFGTDKGFKPTPASPWMPFLDRNLTASNSTSFWDHFCAFSSMIHKDHMPKTLGPTPQSQHAAAPPSSDRVAWEDDSTL